MALDLELAQLPSCLKSHTTECARAAYACRYISMSGRAAVEDLYPRTVRFAEETPDRYALTVSTVQRLTLSCDTLLGICFITI